MTISQTVSPKPERLEITKSLKNLEIGDYSLHFDLDDNCKYNSILAIVTRFHMTTDMRFFTKAVRKGPNPHINIWRVA